MMLLLAWLLVLLLQLGLGLLELLLFIMLLQHFCFQQHGFEELYELLLV
jgi:hypothetical protein